MGCVHHSGNGGQSSPRYDRIAGPSPECMYDTDAQQQRRQSRLALLTALIMLSFATVLATALAWNRHHIRLGPVIAPRGWTISFQPPANWSQSRRVAPGQEDTLFFLELSDGQVVRRLAVHRAVRPLGSPADYALHRWSKLARERIWVTSGQSFSLAPEAPSLADFGDLPGAYLEDVDRGLIVHTGFDETAAYSMELVTSTPPIGPRDTQLVQNVVDSVTVR